MNRYYKIISVIVLLFCIVACSQKEQVILLDKDGEKYQIADKVSFYHPKSFKIDSSNENKKVVRFVNENQTMTYSTIVESTDNKVEDMPALYAGQLEEDGAIEVGYKNVKIKSGITCQEFTGSYKSTGMKFKHTVYFTQNATYAYTYQAPQDIYEKEISTISQYLESLIVHE
ncbi:MAG: hypothetical protein RR585_12780 [Coprobacillus sp.]